MQTFPASITVNAKTKEDLAELLDLSFKLVGELVCFERGNSSKTFPILVEYTVPEDSAEEGNFYFSFSGEALSAMQISQDPRLLIIADLVRRSTAV